MPVIGSVHVSLLSYFFLLDGNCENLLTEMIDYHKSPFVLLHQGWSVQSVAACQQCDVWLN